LIMVEIKFISRRRQMYVDMRKRSSVDCVKLGIFLFTVIVNICKYFIVLVYKNILTTACEQKQDNAVFIVWWN
jgi:hypothetical protein